ncbi:MAG: hypothetical protein ACRDI1_02560, partial [Actinomycetota bacterium]
MPEIEGRARLAAAAALLLLASCGVQDARSEDDGGHFSELPQSRRLEPLPEVRPVSPSLQATIPVEYRGYDQQIVETAAAVPGVAYAARVSLGLIRTESDAGVADITVAAVHPLEYRPLAPEPTAKADFVWQGLRTRQIYLAHEEYRRLGTKPGSNLFLRGENGIGGLFRIGGVAANGIPNLGGALISMEQAASLGLGPPSLLVISVQPGVHPHDVRQTLIDRMSIRFDLMASTTSRAFITGPEAAKLFGSFAFTVNRDGTIIPDQNWVAAYITSQRVPILGVTRCHRLMFPQLLGALTEVEQSGLANLINPSDYGGCYSARLVRGEDPADPH